MKVLFATQGKYGERIAEYVAANRPQGWEILRLPLRRNLPMVIDDPDEVVRDMRNKADGRARDQRDVKDRPPILESPFLCFLSPSFGKGGRIRRLQHG